MRVGLCCATERGRRVLEALASMPDVDVVVASHREETWEPPFFDNIKSTAAQTNSPLFETKKIGNVADDFFAKPIDALICVNWRYLIPSTVYRRARLGGFTLHDSVLPAYRGFSPTVWAMINGETATGVTLLEMVDEVDAGDIYAQQEVPIGSDDDIQCVLNRVTDAYVDIVTRKVPALLNGELHARAQDHTAATFTTKLGPEDFAIDWSWPSRRIHDLVRATTRPYAGAHTTLGGESLTIWKTRLENNPPSFQGAVIGRHAGTTPDGGVRVITGDGSIVVTEVQIQSGQLELAASVLTSVYSTLGIPRAIRITGHNGHD